MSSTDQLARTITLFQTDLEILDAGLIERALTRLEIALVAGDAVMRTRAGQIAVLTSAMLLARSGHKVFINVFDVPLIGHQPPFQGATVYEAITNLRGQLIEGSDISIGYPVRPSIAFDFAGRSCIAPFKETRTVSVGWSRWVGELADWPWKPPCTEDEWPMGAMAAAVLVAAEAVKVAAWSLAPVSGHPGYVRELFAPSRIAMLRLAPEHTPTVSTLGAFDIISAGAVSNAFLYALLRLPDVVGEARSFDRDFSDQANRNRNMLLIAALEHLAKVDLFAHFGRGLLVRPVRRHFVEADLTDLAPNVAVGVDDIPTRWLLAGAQTNWMGVGATTDFGSMASIHFPYSACAACQHPHNEDAPGPTPTIAFVSFLSGLLVAADFLVEISRSTANIASKQRLVFPLRSDTPNGVHATLVSPRADCPARCPASQIKRTGT